jgi:hypothetical protein
MRMKNDKLIQIRVSQAEKDQFQTQASNAGLSVAEYVRNLVDRDAPQSQSIPH